MTQAAISLLAYRESQRKKPRFINGLFISLLAKGRSRTYPKTGSHRGSSESVEQRTKSYANAVDLIPSPKPKEYNRGGKSLILFI